ncbi:MAG: twin-arginine translocase subunit TatC [Proteobacteria bacterium]|nr:twin-arginine translocase subunit TatC [Pseudomonadota bacterium]
MIAILEQFAPHQAELRRRLICCCVAILLTSAAAYLFKDEITAWCMRPLHLAYPQVGKMVYTKLTDAFLTYIKLSLLVGVIVAFPYLLYQVWLFVAPGLLEREKRTVRTITLWASLLFLAGAAFAFFVALPRMLHFFMGYASPTLQPMLKLGLYLTFTARMALAFGIAFEIPFLMVMATRAGLLNRDHFRQKRIPFYIAIAVLSFLLASGEITATALLALPLFALYETGIVACRIFSTQRNNLPDQGTA